MRTFCRLVQGLIRNDLLFALIVFFTFQTTGYGASDPRLNLYVYEDAQGQLSFSDVRSGKVHFEHLKKTQLRFNSTSSVIWIRVAVNSADRENLFLELTTPFLHYVDFYQPNEYGGYTEHLTGFFRNFYTRPILSDRLSFPIVANGDWHYIRLECSHFLNTDFKLLKTTDLMENTSTRLLFYCTYIGVMMIMLAGVLMYVYQSKEYHYLLYFGYVLFISTINLTEKGIYFEFLWPQKPMFNFYFPILPFGVSVCLLLFLKKTFGVDRYATWLWRFTFYIATLTALVPTIWFLLSGEYLPAFVLAQAHGVAIGVLVFLLNIIAYVKSTDNRPFLRLIILGLSFFCAGVVTYLLAQNDVLPINFFTENAIVLGTAIEVCFFTASVALYQSSHIKKYNQLLTIQNEKLEKGIAERTMELKRKNDQLRHSLDEKDNLMNIVAHDLKSPLNQTKGLCYLVSMTVSDLPEAKMMIDRIQEANEHGLKLIDELGTVARLELESNPVGFVEVNISEKMHFVMQNFQVAASKKAIQLNFKTSQMDCVVRTHSPYFQRIVENLLSNAIKFSPAGSAIHVEVNQCEICEISIRDQGPGFSEEDVKKMYRKFQRLSATPTAGEQSTGLGLYIIKLLAERLQIDLVLHSEPGKGAEFKIRFPKALLKQPAALSA